MPLNQWSFFILKGDYGVSSLSPSGPSTFIIHFDTFEPSIFSIRTVHFHKNDRPLWPKIVQFSWKDRTLTSMTVHFGLNDPSLRTVHLSWLILAILVASWTVAVKNLYVALSRIILSIVVGGIDHRIEIMFWSLKFSGSNNHQQSVYEQV